MNKSEHQVPFETVQGHGENTCKLRQGVNQYWFEDTSKEIIGVFYTADWCVCM
jgi:hypothetical protein